MLGFITILLAVALLCVAAFAGYSVGKSKGDARSGDMPPARHPAEEEPYRAGYLAGHRAGWHEALARMQGGAVSPQQPPAAPRTAGAFQAVPSPHQPPAEPVMPVPPVTSAPPPHVPMPPHMPVPPRRPAFVVRDESPAERAARKEKRDRQNINVTLYTASLLLVAAAALFVGTALPAVLRFAGVCLITTLFYVSGFVLHARVPRLRPAAVAFAGTGLALIPVTGLAMYGFALPDGPTAWLVTSLVGTAAYILAAVRLDNKILAFLSLSFLISTAWSGVSVLGGALVWYFTALIAVAVVLTLAALLKPRWLPAVYLKPLMLLHPFVVPLVAVAVTFVPMALAKGEYSVVMTMCGLYFAVMAAIPGTSYRLPHFHGARASFTAALVVGVFDVTGEMQHALLAAVLALAVQSLGAAYATGVASATGRWRRDAVFCFALQLVAAASLGLSMLFGSFGRFGGTGALAEATVPWPLPFFIALLTALALAWKLRGGSEWAPVAALLLAAPFAGVLEAWPTAALLLTAGVYWLMRGFLPGEPHGAAFILAARSVLTVSVPVVAAAIIPEGPDRAAGVLMWLVLAAVAQQLLGAVLIRGGVARQFAPYLSIAGFAAAGLLGLLPLVILDSTPGRSLAATALVGAAVGGFAVGQLLFRPRPAGSAAPDPQTGMGEWLGPVALAWTSTLAFAGLSMSWGNGLLPALSACFALMALRSPVSFRRQCHWWFCRAAGTLLVVTGYWQMLRDGAGVSLAGEELTIVTVLVFASVLQAVLPLWAAVRRGAKAAQLADSAVLLAVMLAVSAVLGLVELFSRSAGEGSWQPGTAAVLAALAAAAAGYVFRGLSASRALAPVAMVVLILARGDHFRDVELLLAIFAAFAAVMVMAVRGRHAKGAYFVAGRVLVAALAVVLCQDITASATAVSLTFAAVLLLQHVVRWLMRNRLQVVPFQQAAVWVTLAAQTALPGTYLLQGGFADGGRWVVLLELAMLFVSAVVAWRWFRARGAGYFAVWAVSAAVAAAGPLLAFPGAGRSSLPLLDVNAVPAILLALALATIAARVLRRGQVPEERWFWFVAAMGFTGAGLLLSFDAGRAWTGAAVLVLAVVLFAASHMERLPAAYAAATPAVLLGSWICAADLIESTGPDSSVFVPLLAGPGAAAALLYTVRCLAGTVLADQPWRRWSLAAAGAGGLSATAVAGLAGDPHALAGALLIAAVAAIAVVEAPRRIKWVVAETGAAATMAAVQRAVLFTGGARPDWFWVLQWYVLLAAVLAGVRYIGRALEGSGTAQGRLRLGIGAVLLSASAVAVIINGSTPQQLWVLLGHLLLLIAGLVLGERMFSWWGAAGVALSIMWALRSYAFAMLALAALGLIVFAVWRLNRTRPQAAGTGALPGEPSSATVDGDGNGRKSWNS